MKPLVAQLRPPPVVRSTLRQAPTLKAAVQAVEKVQKNANLPDLLTFYQLAKL